MCIWVFVRSIINIIICCSFGSCSTCNQSMGYFHTTSFPFPLSLPLFFFFFLSLAPSLSFSLFIQMSFGWSRQMSANEQSFQPNWTSNNDRTIQSRRYTQFTIYITHLCVAHIWHTNAQHHSLFHRRNLFFFSFFCTMMVVMYEFIHTIVIEIGQYIESGLDRYYFLPRTGCGICLFFRPFTRNSSKTLQQTVATVG